MIVTLALSACAPLSYSREPAHTEVTGNHWGDPTPEPPPTALPRE